MFVPGSSQVSNAQSSYQIANSLRFQSASSQYLSRTISTSSNRKTWTWSAWVKRGQISGPKNLMSATDNTTASTFWGFGAYSTAPADTFFFYTEPNQKLLYTNAVFRDPSAWYHIVLVVDTTQATEANRVKIYFNGVQQTVAGTYPAQNVDLQINATGYLNTIGSYWTNLYFYDGYQTEIVLVDGQALTPSSFGETNTLTGQWVAKKYTGTYGTNGFYLPFSNGTSTTTLGADSSGNGNNWTLTNFTRSAGVSDCWMYDVPSGNGGASATQPRSNYVVMNPLDKNSAVTVSNSNLNVTSSTGNTGVRASMMLSTGKWYYETYVVSTPSNQSMIGFATYDWDKSYVGSNSQGIGWCADGFKYGETGTVVSGSLTTYTNGDTLAFSVDMDAKQLTAYKNGTAIYVWNFTGSNWFPACSIQSTTQYAFNFGQRSFAYTPPSGYKALCTANLPDSTIPAGNKYMDATLFTGTGTTQTITNAGGFKPDLVWQKIRSGAGSHYLADSVRGAANLLSTNNTNAEASVPTYLSSFNSNGWTQGTGNYSVGETVVGWQWQAGAGVSATNTDGSVASVVSVNKNSGFSVVTYAAPASGTATIGHGLGVAPKMIIAKTRAYVLDWYAYHQSLGGTKYLILNGTAAATTSAVVWNNTDPTSTVFSLGAGFATTGNMVAYCFAEIAGFSKFGSYTGNGSADGPFVYLGFRPKFVMIKRTDVADNWNIEDTTRNSYNVSNSALYSDSSSAEVTNAIYNLDIVSNGFKIRNTASSSNTSGGTYIYMAFAENPFKNTNAR